MANDKHVRRLREEGVEAWNAWRAAEPEVRPDLSHTILRQPQKRNRLMPERKRCANK